MTMRDLFRGYYKLTENDIAGMWQEGIFAFDANMLLNVYQYSDKTEKSFFEVLRKLDNRIWVPYQAAYEYQERRLAVISEQHKAYQTVIRLLEENLQSFVKGTKAFEKHTHIDISQIRTNLKEAVDKIKSPIQKARSEHPKLHESDTLRDTIDELFKGKIGQPYLSEEDLARLYITAEQRYQLRIPPGYMDANKDSSYSKKYGDVILWFQLIDHARSHKKPIIFITDDLKEDWWSLHEGNIIGPRPELVQEMFTKAGVQFHMYEGYKFIERAEKFLSIEHQQAVIDEIKDIGRKEEDNIYQMHMRRIISRNSNFLDSRAIREDPRLSAQAMEDAKQLLQIVNKDPRFSRKNTEEIKRLVKELYDNAFLTSPSESVEIYGKFLCERCGRSMSKEEYDNSLICSDCLDNITYEKD